MSTLPILHIQFVENITPEMVETCEKVLLWCAEAKFITFDESNLETVLSRTTNILRWNFQMSLHNLPNANDDDLKPRQQS
jgi:hypothetical protein